MTESFICYSSSQGVILGYCFTFVDILKAYFVKHGLAFRLTLIYSECVQRLYIQILTVDLRWSTFVSLPMR